MASADEHDRRARAHAQRASEAGLTGPSPTSYSCGDSQLNDQLTTGTERVTSWVPCWNVDEETEIEQDQAAQREHAAARKDRAQAAALVRAELSACKGIPARERNHSPLAHRSAIAEVIPHRDGGELVGVDIEMKPVVALTADYMRRAIACHRARYVAVGGDPAGDPTLLPGADVEVNDRGDHLEVLVHTKTAADGEIAYARAQDLLHPRTAHR